MGIARSTYYGGGPAGDDTALIAAIAAICDEFEAYGWRRVQAALRQQGINANHKKIKRLMRRVWAAKYEAGAFDDEAETADLMQAYEAKIAALERLVGKQALELEFLKGLYEADGCRETGLHP